MKTPSIPLLALALAACSSGAPDEDLELDSGLGSGSSGGDVGDDDGAEGGEDGMGTGGDGADDGGGGSTGEPKDPTDGDGAPPLNASCPDRLPEGWIFCEDFSSLLAPLEKFSEYADGDGAFVIDPEAAAMRADYQPGVESTGWLLVAFGRTPIQHTGGRTYAPEEQFEEVYWRMRVKHEKGWPDVGPGTLTRATAFADEAWAEALIAQLQSAGAQTHLEAVPMTCVAGADVECAGYNDQAALESQGSLEGATPLFSHELSGEWHCVEGHVELNTPGAADGVFEFSVDGQLEASRTDIDWRGTWASYGINAVTLENFWPAGPDQPLTRWIDDVVVSTVPIGCD